MELVDSVDELRSPSSIRGISMPNFEVLDARIASALKKSSVIRTSKRRISLEEQKAQKQDRFLRVLPDLRVLPGHWSQRLSRTLPTYSLLVFDDKLDAQKINFNFAQFNRIRNHFLGCRIEVGW